MSMANCLQMNSELNNRVGVLILEVKKISSDTLSCAVHTSLISLFLIEWYAKCLDSVYAIYFALYT